MHKAARTVLDRILVAREGSTGSKWRQRRTLGGDALSGMVGALAARSGAFKRCLPRTKGCLRSRCALSFAVLQCPESASHLVCCFSVTASFGLEGLQGW